MKTLNIFSWNKDSQGAGALAEALGIKKIKHEKSRYVGNKNKIVINWGASELPEEVTKSTVLNGPARVKSCTNKKTFFEILSNAKERIFIPDWTDSLDQATDWIANGHTVFARKVLNGHSGEGIVVMSKDDMSTLNTKAPLYTKYVPKREEFRVHVFDGEVIDVQKKALRNGYLEENGKANFLIRNLNNGFIFMRNNIKIPDSVTREAVKAVKEIGLIFGAVDVIWQEKKDQGYVLEINTAPGLEGQTINSYAEAFRKKVNS